MIDPTTGQVIPDYVNPNQTPTAVVVAPPVPAPFAPQAPPPTPIQPTAPAQQPAPLRQMSPIEAAANMTPEELALRASVKQAPYRPAVTQEQIDQAANSGTFVKQAETHGVVGGSTAAYADIDKIQEARIEAAHQQSIADKLQANANMDNAAAAAAQAAKQRDVMAWEQQVSENAWNDKYSELQREMAPENNRVNPNRFFSNAGILGSAMAIAGAALEARGAARRGTQNPQTLMRFIDNDIRAQQLEMIQKGQAANNQLARLSQQWGSIEAGKQALRVAQLDAVNTNLKSQALVASDPATKSAIDAQTAQNDAQIAADTAHLKAIYGGQESMQVQGAVMRPQKAQGGGASIDYGKLAALRAGLREETRKDAEVGIKNQVSPEQAENEGGRAAILDALERYRKAQGLEERNGKIEKPEGWVDQLPRGSLYRIRHPSNITANSMFANEKQEEAEAAADNAATLIAKKIYGARVNEATVEFTKQQLVGHRANEVVSRLNEMRDTINKEQSVSQTAKSDVTRAQQAKNYRRERSINDVEPYRPGAD